MFLVLLRAVVAISVVGVAAALSCSSDKAVTYTTTEFARENCALCGSKDALLTAVLLFHNECESLKFATKQWSSLPRNVTDHVHFLVVDNHSRFPANTCVTKGAPVTIARVESDPMWNIGGARNLGAYLSCSEYLFISDIDAYMSGNLLQTALHHIRKHQQPQSTIFQFDRHMMGYNKIHPGIMVINRDWYWSIHGCDEDFVGHYGMTDPHLKHRSTKNGGAMTHKKDLYMCQVVSAVDEEHSKELPKQSRSIAVNSKLLEDKIAGRVPWNHTVLRFDWRIVEERPEVAPLQEPQPFITLTWGSSEPAKPSDC